MKLETTESTRLVELEAVITKGQRTFVEVGMALAEIRENRLYRAEFETFEDYCQNKWSFTRQYVNQIIAGAAAVKSLPADLETVVSNQAQARELSKASPEDRAAVVRDVAKSGDVTAEAIKRKIEERDELEANEQPDRPRVEAANLDDYSDQGQKRDLDLASVKSNLEAVVTNVIHYAPKGELSAFKLFLEREASRVGMANRQHKAEMASQEKES